MVKKVRLTKFAGVVFTMVLMIAATGVMHASAIVGSMSFVGVGVTQNGANLSVSTVLSDTSNLTTGGLGDYSGIPLFTNYGPFTLDLTTLATGGGFSLTNATYGTFAAATGSLVSRTANFLNVDLIGTYTPGPGMPVGVTAGPTELSISFTQRGNSISVSETIVSPPTSVPEPGTLALFGSGIIGVAAILRRKINP
jgi:hypothetical protein